MIKNATKLPWEFDVCQVDSHIQASIWSQESGPYPDRTTAERAAYRALKVQEATAVHIMWTEAFTSSPEGTYWRLVGDLENEGMVEAQIRASFESVAAQQRALAHAARRAHRRAIRRAALSSVAR
jgi:hypothetical protein